MFYKKSTAAIAAIFDLILLAILFVCAPRPYSGCVWLEAFMLVMGGVGFGAVCVRLCNAKDSPLPVSVLRAQFTFRWLIFAALMATPLLFADWNIQFKYYALVHFIGLGVWAIYFIAAGMSIRNVEQQDAAHPVALETRRRFYQELSRLINEMSLVKFGAAELGRKLSRLQKDFRYGFGCCEKTVAEDGRIAELLDKLRTAFNARNEIEMAQLVDRLQLEFNNRERIVRM